MSNNPQKKAPGRPRSEASRRALLDATTRLLSEHSIRDLTIEGIAREAGVGKPTIYRWWGDKCLLVMDAYFDSMAPELEIPPGDTTMETLATFVQRVVRILQGPAGRIAAEMVGEGQSRPQILEDFRERFFTQLLGPARQTLAAGQAAGEIDPELDVELALTLLFGPVFYRLLIGGQALDEQFAEELCQRVLPTFER